MTLFIIHHSYNYRVAFSYYHCFPNSQGWRVIVLSGSLHVLDDEKLQRNHALSAHCFLGQKKIIAFGFDQIFLS